jgi:cytochrome b561
MAHPKGYSITQIALHWIAAVLILLQYVLNDWISEAWDAFKDGQPIVFDPLVAQHVFGGILIALLAFWRISLRMRLGAPPPPEDEAPALKLAAKATHGLLYLLMFTLPLSGGIAWFLGQRAAAEAHEIGTTVFMVLIGLHIVGALYHQLVLKNNLMQRMKRPAA